MGESVRAGFDLTKIDEKDLNTHGDTLELVLPQAEIFDIIMNLSDFSTEYEKGEWSHERTKPMKVRAKAELEKNAIESNILQKAEENGLKRLESLFQTFGFNTVQLSIKGAKDAPVEEAAPKVEEVAEEVEVETPAAETETEQ